MGAKALLLTNRKLRDLNPLVAGEEICAPGHSFGPAVRRYTLIHYVIRGKGILYARGGAHPVSAGQAFIILPGETTTYVADLQDPWYYRWIGFDGVLSQPFSQLPPVLDMPETFFTRMMHFSAQPSVIEYLLAGELFSLYAYLFKHTRDGNSHVRKVENYIRSNYMHPIRVERIAEELGLNRRYLSRRFKEETGRSIQEYLIHVRLREAEQLLLHGCSVKETAVLVGYEDISNFSKMFKRYTGKTPLSVMRKSLSGH